MIAQWYTLDKQNESTFSRNSEIKIHEHTLSENYLYWYINADIIYCFTGTDMQLQSFFVFLNELYPKIKFTYEIKKK